MHRIERDPEGGWIARNRDGSEIGAPGYRWNTRAGARCAVWDAVQFGSTIEELRAARIKDLTNADA